MEETFMHADFSIVKAQKADRKGNLYYNKTARNFNEDAVLAGKIRVAEVEEIVENGELDPDLIHTPGIFVDRVFKGEKFEGRFEKHVYDHSDEPKKPAD
jgi:acyl CoA:acetate/3-ketoacid CoA transferase alpha subunit